MTDVLIALGCTFALGALAVGVLIAGELLTQRRRRRRARNVDELTVRLRIDDLRAMPAPDELPRARDLSKGEVRQLRGRQHPIAHKRGSRRYGA